MSLLACPECNTTISDKAAACPKCGCPLPTNEGSQGAQNFVTLSDNDSNYMALFVCEECGASISDKTENCLHCGLPLQKKLVNRDQIDTEVVNPLYEITRIGDNLSFGISTIAIGVTLVGFSFPYSSLGLWSSFIKLSVLQGLFPSFMVWAGFILGLWLTFIGIINTYLFLSSNCVSKTSVAHNFLKRFALSVGVIFIIHFSVVQWMHTSYMSDMETAYKAYIAGAEASGLDISQIAAGLPEINPPSGYRILMLPYGFKAVNEAGGVLPIGGAAINSLIWAFYITFLIRHITFLIRLLREFISCWVPDD